MKNILKFRLTRHLLSATMGIGLLAVLIVGNVGTALADGGGNLSPTINGGSLSVTNTSSPTSGSVSVPVKAATSDGSTISFGSATATSIYNAAADTGMGINGLTAGFTVSLPANTTYAGSYTSAFTVTIASAP